MKESSTRRRDRIASWSWRPSWVEASLDEPGSTDPLGYQTEADRIAEELLPGVTVQTRRARYLSFLCWAMDRTGNNPAEIDRWEIALSIGEYLHHKGNTTCSYLGILLLKQRNPDPGDRVPARLHQQTARALYSGLLRSCGLASEEGELTPLGKKLGWEFGKKMPGTRPKRVYGCANLPCVSAAGEVEKRWLRGALLEETEEAKLRTATLREVGIRLWKKTMGDPTAILPDYLRPPARPAGREQLLLHKAAVLELTALPLTSLFLYLYRHEGAIRGPIPRSSKLGAYRVDPDPPGLLADVAAHLRRAAKLGGEQVPLSLAKIKSHLLDRHQRAKPDGQWVDGSWQVLRYGLAPQVSPDVHGYRLTAFVSLLRDVGAIA